MKKPVLLILAVIALSLQANSQEISKNAIGIRLSESDGFGPEVNYQRAVGDNNRLEFGLAFHSHRYHDAVKLTGIYQWVWNIEDGFNWYAGVGGGVGSVSDNRIGDRRGNDGTFLFLAGDIGIEYNFDIPLMLSLDFRPEFGFNDYTVLNEFSPDIALGVRYQF